ncbi:MAG: hypothetical protein ACK5ME_12860 [Parahaliea sp.]
MIHAMRYFPYLTKRLISVFTRVLVGLTVLAILPVLSVQAKESQRSRFDQLVTALQGAALEDKADFAHDALAELYALYSAESDLARSEERVSKKGSGLRQWATSVDSFSQRLMHAAEQVDAGAWVDISYRHTGVQLWLPELDLRILLEHPRQSQQAAYERAVLASFCRAYRCDRLLLAGSDRGEQKTHERSSGISPPPVVMVWTFSAGGPSCQANGLELKFAASQNADNVREPCRQLHREMSAVLQELRWQQRRGVQIEWTELAIEPASSSGHVIKLNHYGDAALIDAPLIADSTGLLTIISDWLQSRVNSDTGRASIEAGMWVWGS